MKNDFASYKPNGSDWITLATGEYYPDILPKACELYKPVLVLFGELLKTSYSSEDLFKKIIDETSWMMIQLSRVFRKYVSPETPVEMLKMKNKMDEIIGTFGKGFRKISEVQSAFNKRPIPDEALCALLYEYKDRGKKGYDLTESLFYQFRKQFPKYQFTGPERAGQDIRLGEVWDDIPKKDRPVDFVIKDKKGNVVAIGLARYDSDRGGAQEDDRTGGYRECAAEIITYCKSHKLKTKVIFINDGPGLLLGSMWDDYSKLEAMFNGKVIVATLRMIPERITEEWLNQ